MVTELRFVTLDVFTTKRYRGNPLGVVFLPDPSTQILTQAQKQTIAQEFNLSETIFVHPGNTGSTRTIDIFAPDVELPFAGHPTIGAASWFLVHSPSSGPDAVQKLLMKAGEVPITLQPDGPSAPNAVSAQIAHDVRIHGKRFPVTELLEMFPSLSPFFPAVQKGEGKTDVATFPVFSIVKGMSQVFVELPSLEALAAVKTAAGGEELTADRMELDGAWRTGMVVVYFYVRDVEDEVLGRKVIRSRMILGNEEDAATGSAASGLAAYLSLIDGGKGEFKYDVIQGVEMGRRSDIGVAVVVDEEGKVEKVELKGSAVKISEGMIRVPDE